VHVLAVVPVFASLAAQPPEWPPATRVNAMPAPEPDVFQPLRSVSKPGLPARLATITCAVAVAVAVDDRPPVSVTVTVAVYAPGAVYVCAAVAPACGPTTVEPSPKSKVYVAIGVESPSVEPDASAVTARGAFPDPGVTVSAAIGASEAKPG
jgi:hypothetical protein